MGVVQVTATVRNPAQPERSWGGLVLKRRPAVRMKRVA